MILESRGRRQEQLKAQNVVVMRLVMPSLDQFQEAAARDRARLAGTKALIAVRIWTAAW
jgi:hypothetical protein